MNSIKLKKIEKYKTILKFIIIFFIIFFSFRYIPNQKINNFDLIIASLVAIILNIILSYQCPDIILRV